MSDTDTTNSPPITVRAVEAPYGQAWRLGMDGAGEDHRHGEFIESQRSDAGEGHIGTRLTRQADADARRDASEAAGWDRFMRLANARNIERGVKP
jgi:hypothetical protein